MKKSTFAAALLFGALAFVGCSDDSSSGGTKGFRLEFDAPALAAKLNTDFESFRTSCEKYATTSSSGADLELKGYVWADQDSVLLRIAVTEDRYGNVGRIDASPRSTTPRRKSRSGDTSSPMPMRCSSARSSARSTARPRARASSRPSTRPLPTSTTTVRTTSTPTPSSESSRATPTPSSRSRTDSSPPR